MRQLTPYRRIERPRWSRDGRRIVFGAEGLEDLDDPANGIWEVRASGAPMRQLLATTAVKPDYSPDGRQSLFTCFIRQQDKKICARWAPTAEAYGGSPGSQH